MTETSRSLTATAILISVAALPMQRIAGQAAGNDSDNPDARPPVTKADVRIVQRSRQILNSLSMWNRADTGVCQADAKTFARCKRQLTKCRANLNTAAQRCRRHASSSMRSPQQEELPPPPDGL